MEKMITFALMCVVSLNVMAMDFTDKYPREELIIARAAWLDQENRIGQLKQEAKHVKNTPLDFWNEQQLVARIDATKEIIETFSEKDKSVSLTYQQFDAFIQDEELLNETILLLLLQEMVIKGIERF